MLNALFLRNEAGLHVTIPTEPVGSIPRPRALLNAISEKSCTFSELNVFYEDAIRDTIARFEATGSPVITDGEHRKIAQFLDIQCRWIAEHGNRWI